MRIATTHSSGFPAIRGQSRPTTISLPGKCFLINLFVASLIGVRAVKNSFVTIGNRVRAVAAWIPTKSAAAIEYPPKMPIPVPIINPITFVSPKNPILALNAAASTFFVVGISLVQQKAEGIDDNIA